MALLCTPIGAEDTGEERSIRLFLRAIENGDDGLFEVTIDLSSTYGVCAVLCELDYNPDSLIFLSCGAGTDNLNLTFLDFGGTLRLLVDSPENSPPECELVRLYFKRIGNDAADLALTCLNALCLDENFQILSANFTVLADLPSDEQDNTKAPTPLPKIIHASAQEGRISFDIAVNGDCFAAGVRLFFVDLGGEGENFEVIVAGIVGQDKILRGEHRYRSDKSYAIVVTALGYDKHGAARGEKIVLISPWKN